VTSGRPRAEGQPGMPASIYSWVKAKRFISYLTPSSKRLRNQSLAEQRCMKRGIAPLAVAIVICSAGVASGQKGPFMDNVIPAADAQIGQSLWAMGYRFLPPGSQIVQIHPLDKVKVVGFVTDPATGSKNVRLERDGATGDVPADWRMWVAKDPKQTKCRDVSPQIGWSDATVLRAMKCAPDHINSTATQMHDRQQWVYGGNYLYFEDGTLVAIQRRN
jgi:hypothetical protein